MSKFFVILLLLIYSAKSDTEYKFDLIKEFIPKTIFCDGTDKIFKYNLSCEEWRKESNIYFQIKTNYYKSIYLYDDYEKIKKNENRYINYTNNSIIDYRNQVIPFNKLTCNKDYYFIVQENYDDMENQYYYQISIVNEETKSFNLSPILSQYYTLVPREKNKGENFYYSFNETKYALIDYEGYLKIEENGKTIDINNKLNLFEFKKGLNYSIYYKSDSPIHFQFYNKDEYENNFFKYNIENFPIILYGINKKYFIEINISNYKIGEYILFQTYDKASWHIKYQYKNDFINNNFIDLGDYIDLNYIPIKKTKNDSSLILYINCYNSYNLLSILKIVKDDVKEIESDFNSTVNGPKILFFDYNKFNNLRSFAIESNKNFFFFEQAMEIHTFKMKKEIYDYIYINKQKQNTENPQFFKKGFIYLNSTDIWHLVVKKFNFSIIDNKNHVRFGNEYLDLCQGEEPKTELYYYIDKHSYELFTPVFGNFDAIFIKESEIKTLSDFNFNKTKETNIFIFKSQNGYIKFVCKEPTMIKNSYFYYFDKDNILTSGRKYIYSVNTIPQNINLSDILIGKQISLKFTLLGAKDNYQAELYLNGTKYILGNKSLEFELEYSYQEAGSYLINFNVTKSPNEQRIIVIVVGMKDDLKNYQIKNLNESFGNLNDEGKGIIIKIPKGHDDNYYNFSIIQQYSSYYYGYYIEISYDKIEFMPSPINQENNEFSRIITFNVNPYSYITNNCEESDEKFFYIFIFKYGKISEYNLLIKRPKLFTDIDLKKTNIFPQLKGEDEKYYYKIPLPNEDYDYYLIQTDNNVNLTFSQTKDNIIYPLESIYYTSLFNEIVIYNIPIDLLNKNTYLNYYGNSLSDRYVRFIPRNGFFNPPIYAYFSFDLNATQKEKTNKFIIQMKSFSYEVKRTTIYYLIINEFNDYKNDKIFISVLTEEKFLDKNKAMLKVEDNGENENFQTEVEINIELFDYEHDHFSNSMIIVPVDKETNLVYIHMKNSTYFNFINENSKSNFVLIIIIVIAILLLIIIIGFLIYWKKKKEKSNNIVDEINMNEKILSDN